MTEVIFYTATSLDGFIADDEGSLGWLFAVDHSGVGSDIDDFTARVGVQVQGSTTYEWVLREEGLLEHPAKWQEFSGDRPTYVFSSRELPVPEGADVRFVRGSVAEALPAIIEAAGERAVWVVGGGDLAGQFHDAGALDELIVTVAPVTLGGGAPLLPRRIGAERLSLSEVRQLGQFAQLSYRVKPG